MTPEVSVVIPTRDRPELLARTLRGALAQRDVAFEVVVVDDASDPPVAPMADDRVRVVRQPAQQGVAAARNRGIGEARAPWVAFLDDDDLWAPDKLARQLAALAGGAPFAYATALVVDGRLRPRAVQPAPAPASLLREVLAANVVPAGTSNVVARRAVLEDLGGFDTDFGFLADWDMWIRLAAAGPAVACDDVLVAYVQHAASWTQARTEDARAELDALAAKHAELARTHGTGIDRVRFDRYVAVALRRAGRPRDAARLYAASAWRERSPGSLLRGLATLAGEPLLTAMARRRSPPPPAPGWLADR